MQYHLHTTVLVAGLMTGLIAGAAPDSLAAARRAVTKMRRLHVLLAHQSTAHEKAKTWLALQKAAENVSKGLGTVPPPERTPSKRPSDKTMASQLAEEATALGVKVDYCDPAGQWVAAMTGYLTYLTLWPDGPEADTAYWKGRVRGWCGDFEPSVEAYEEGIRANREFILHFPRSRLRPQAAKQIQLLEEGLAQERRKRK